MAYSVQTLLNDVASATHGTTINKIPNVYGLINRASRSVLLDVDPKETQRIVQMPQIFQNVYDYACPPDLKGDRLVDLRLQAGRMPWMVFTQTYAETFDAGKLTTFLNKIYTQWNTGVKTLRIQAPFLTSPTTLTDTGTLDGWAVDGAGCVNISLNTTNNPAGGGAIQCNLSAGFSSGTITNSSLFPVDMSALANIATGFMWVYLPSGAAINSITLSWGSDASDYYYSTASATQQNTAFIDGWNLVAFDWSTAGVTGTPDPTQLSYCQVSPSWNGTLQTGFEFCNVQFADGYYFDLQYYSKYLFRDPNTNVFQETVNSILDNGKIINLDTESYNLLFNKTAFLVAQSLQGADAAYDADYWQTEYNNALTRYRAQNPSESIEKAEPYYRIMNKGYGKFVPGLWRR